VTVLLVALGAAVGAPLRYATAHLLDGRVHLGTIAVNVVGSFLLGLFSALALTGVELALFGTGFCGALTTYSAFAVHTHDGGFKRGSLNAVLTVGLSLGACALGFALGQA